MTTQKQIIANRQNAKHSTGPQSEEGKAIVCHNAVKHGILCQKIPIDQGDADSFNEFSSRLFIELNPVGDFEQFIVDRIVSSAWRLRRIINIETAFYKSQLNSSYSFQDANSIKDAFTGPSKERMAVLSRYETAIEKSLYKAMAELARLQAVRQGHFHVPLSKFGFVSQNCVEEA